jgi:hypothetical protein
VDCGDFRDACFFTDANILDADGQTAGRSDRRLPSFFHRLRGLSGQPEIANFYA